MFAKHQDVESRTYVHVAHGAAIRVRRYREAADDIISVRFGDERLVPEFDEGILPRLVEALRTEK
jgi:hypothetical protein